MSTIITMTMGTIIVLTVTLFRWYYKKEKKRAERLQRIDSDIISLYKMKTCAASIEDPYQSALLFARINAFILVPRDEDNPNRMFKEEYELFLSETKVLAYMDIDSNLDEDRVEERKENALQYINYLITALERCRKKVIYM